MFNSNELLFCSFFSGIGGADGGLMKAGFKHVFGVDYNPDVVSTRKKLYGEEIQFADFLSLKSEDVPYADLYWFSPSCKNYSQAGRRQTNSKDEECPDQITNLVKTKLPRWVVIENVKEYIEPLHEIRLELNQAGYSTMVHVVNSAEYGCYQNRKRAILLASLEPYELYPLHISTPRPWGLSLLEPGVLANLIPAPDLPISEDLKKGTWLISHSGRPIRSDQPSNTVTGGWLRARPRVVINGEIFRGGVALGAALQGLRFPPNGWPQDQTHADMVGDAVPGQLAYAIGLGVRGLDWRVSESQVNGAVWNKPRS
jgi:DNA (cytosine-5)-methyltransferase 1